MKTIHILYAKWSDGRCVVHAAYTSREQAEKEREVAHKAKAYKGNKPEVFFIRNARLVEEGDE